MMTDHQVHQVHLQLLRMRFFRGETTQVVQHHLKRCNLLKTNLELKKFLLAHMWKQTAKTVSLCMTMVNMSRLGPLTK